MVTMGHFVIQLNNCLQHPSINQSINQSNLYSAPSRYLLRGATNPGQAEKDSLDKAVELRGALDLLEVHSRLLDQPQKKKSA